MKDKKVTKAITRNATFKGELVDDKDKLDHDPTGRFMQNNPYKTPPNNLTTKNK